MVAERASRYLPLRLPLDSRNPLGVSPRNPPRVHPETASSGDRKGVLGSAYMGNRR